MAVCNDHGNQCLRGDRGAENLSTARRSDDRAPEYGSRPAPALLPNGVGCEPQRESRGRVTGRRSKTYLRVATLNMRGAGADVQGGIGEKWMRINQVLWENKIAVLALQETHLPVEGVEAIHALFGEYMSVFASAYPGNETGRCGVAFAINRRILKHAVCSVDVLVPGRALVLNVCWPADTPLCIVNVYGPNDAAENGEMWAALGGSRSLVGRPVDILLGDFNVVKDPIDRLPARPDRDCSRTALAALLSTLNLRDEWREDNPDLKAFTYMHASNGSQSRLDRIYTRRVRHREVVDWTVSESGLCTDHSLVAVSIYDRKALFVGKGRWAMPKHLLTDDKLIGVMKELATELLTELEQHVERTQSRNPQTAYQTFKEKLVSAVRARAKEKVPKMQRQIDAMRADLQATLNPTLHHGAQESASTLDAERQRHAAVLQERLSRLEQRRFEVARKTVAMKQRLCQETMTKQWTRS
ncbi:DNase I-like protein, partial [Cubamyces sp. BRFM 1775]